MQCWFLQYFKFQVHIVFNGCAVEVWTFHLPPVLKVHLPSIAHLPPISEANLTSICRTSLPRPAAPLCIATYIATGQSLRCAYKIRASKSSCLRRVAVDFSVFSHIISHNHIQIHRITHSAWGFLWITINPIPHICVIIQRY